MESKSENTDQQSSNYPPLTMNIKSGSPAIFQLSLVFTTHSCGRCSLCFWGEHGTPGPVARNTGVVLIAATVISQPPSLCQLTCLSSIHLSPKAPVAERGVKGKMPASGSALAWSILQKQRIPIMHKTFTDPLREKLQYQAPPLITHQPCGPPPLRLLLGN